MFSVFVRRQAPFPTINSAEYRRRAPRRDYKLILVQRKAPRRDYKLFFVQRKAPRHDYKLFLVQRRAPRHDYKLILMQRKAPRHDYSIMFVHRRSLFRQSYDASHTRNGRGGACVPARTSAQRRFHPQRARSPPAKAAFLFINNVCSHQNMFVHCADGCALMGRHGRAHRHRPYQPPSNTSTTQSSLIL